MESILFVTKGQLLEADLLHLVGSFGGKWNDDPTLNHGVIREGAAIVYVNKPRAASTEYSDDALTEFARVLGAPPREVVSIDVGHGDGSLDLVRRVVNAFLGEWDGMIDGNSVIESITRHT